MSLKISRIKREEFDWDKKRWVVQKDFLSGCENFTEPMDLEYLAWRNSADTVVFRLKGAPISLEEMCSFVRIFGSAPDELDANIVEGNVVIRMWWD